MSSRFPDELLPFGQAASRCSEPASLRRQLAADFHPMPRVARWQTHVFAPRPPAQHRHNWLAGSPSGYLIGRPRWWQQSEDRRQDLRSLVEAPRRIAGRAVRTRRNTVTPTVSPRKVDHCRLNEFVDLVPFLVLESQRPECRLAQSASSSMQRPVQVSRGRHPSKVVVTNDNACDCVHIRCQVRSLRLVIPLDRLT